MTLRSTAARIAIASVVVALAIVCLSSRTFASIAGVVTIAAVVFDLVVHDAPEPPRPADRLVVDLVGRAERR